MKFDKLIGAPVEFEDRMIEYGVSGISSRSSARRILAELFLPRVVANPPACLQLTRRLKLTHKLVKPCPTCFVTPASQQFNRTSLTEWKPAKSYCGAAC